MRKKKITVIIIAILVIVIIVAGGSYAWFNYFQESNINNLLVAGQINMRLNEGEDTIVLTNVFPETKEEARRHDNNTLSFTVYGANTSTRTILYNILLNQGTAKTGKTRYKDDELRFDLVEIIDNNEVYLVEDTKFNSITNANLYDNLIPGNTNNVNHNYKLRIWIDKDVKISETSTGSHVYTPNEYKKLLEYIYEKPTVRGRLWVFEFISF